MKDVMEHYGSGLLAILGGAVALAIYSGMMEAGGGIYDIVMVYMKSICG